MAINNLNPRRTVWFSPNEPSNKYDIWLSKNAHLDENGEPTTDSNSQRDCDYIFKIYDCGKWNPIVGFNSTAANKIDIVEGNTLYHPAIFTGENPNDLYDAGTLGSLLSNPNFVTELEWYDVFNSSNYEWSSIFGDTNWFGDLIWETIQEGSSTYHLPWATTEVCGGILSATHPAVSPAFKPIEVKFYPAVLGYYQNEQHRLCVSASDVIEQINNYYNDNPGSSSININWNSTTIHQLAEVLLDIFKNSSSLGFEDVWNLASDPHVYPHIWGVNPSNAGKFLRINPTWNPEGAGWNQSNNNMDWVDLQEWFNDNYELNLASTTNLGGIMATTHQTFAVPHLIECKLGSNNYFSQGNEYKRNALHVSVQDIIEELEKWYASNESSIWDLTIQSNYGINTMQHTSVDDEGVTHVAYAHVLDHYTESMKDGLYPRNKTYVNPVPGLYNGTKGLEWVTAHTIVEEGLGVNSGTGYLYYNGSAFVLDSGTGGGSETTYNPLNSSNYTTAGNYVIGVPSEGTGGSTRYLNGLGQWTTPPNTTYNDFTGSSHGLVPASTSASQNKYLKGDGTWGIPTVSAAFNINLAASIQNDDNFTLNDLRLSSSSPSNPINRDLAEWNYYNITGGDKTTQFTFTNTHNSGNAIYIRFTAGAHSDVTINTNADIIFSNIPLASSSIKKFDANNSYLITIQFGIIKIELITT